jgi:protein SCO1/2
MSRNQSVFIAGIVAIVAIVAGMLLARALFDRSAPTQLGLAGGTLLTPPRPLPEIHLVDQDGAAFTPENLKGRWSLLFFGFTHCPDVCPTTLGMLSRTEKDLADLPTDRRPHIVFVSVDPLRDTPQQIKPYVAFFSPTFTGVTGTSEAIEDFTTKLGVPVVITPASNGEYTVDHSAAIFLVDPQGALHALFSGPHDPARIAADYRQIVEAS